MATRKGPISRRDREAAPGPVAPSTAEQDMTLASRLTPLAMRLLQDGPGSTQVRPADLLALQRTLGNQLVARLAPCSRVPGRTAARSVPQAIQRVTAPTQEELAEQGEKLALFSAQAPTTGSNLWRLLNPTTNTTLYLLGTVHVKVDTWPNFAKREEILAFLEGTRFDRVFTELSRSLSEDIATIIGKVRKDFEAEKLRPPGQPWQEGDEDRRKKVAWVKYLQKKSSVGWVASQTDLIDDVWPQAAAKASGARVESLETREIRQEFEDKYKSQGLSQEKAYGGSEDVYAGNQQELIKQHSGRLAQGIDADQTEGRNRYWLESQQEQGALAQQDATILWTVGASHLAGLILSLKQAGWQAETHDL